MKLKSLLPFISLLAVGELRAATVISDFSNFNLTGTYVQWGVGTFTSNPTNFQVQANDFGGGWHDLAPTVGDATATELEVQLDVNAGNVATKFNVVLIDGDGTERVFRFEPIAIGAGQTLTKDLSDFLQDNNPGGVAGLDTTNLVAFHLQGTFENGDPGVAMDLTFDNLALVPEPSTALLGLVGCLGLLRRRR